MSVSDAPTVRSAVADEDVRADDGAVRAFIGAQYYTTRSAVKVYPDHARAPDDPSRRDPSRPSTLRRLPVSTLRPRALYQLGGPTSHSRPCRARRAKEPLLSRGGSRALSRRAR